MSNFRVCCWPVCRQTARNGWPSARWEGLGSLLVRIPAPLQEELSKRSTLLFPMRDADFANRSRVQELSKTIEHRLRHRRTIIAVRNRPSGVWRIPSSGQKTHDLRPRVSANQIKLLTCFKGASIFSGSLTKGDLGHFLLTEPRSGRILIEKVDLILTQIRDHSAMDFSVSCEKIPAILLLLFGRSLNGWSESPDL